MKNPRKALHNKSGEQTQHSQPHPMSKTRLLLTWYNKDKALIPTERGRYSGIWIEPEGRR